MADFHSQWKLHGHRYNYTKRRAASPSYKRLYRETSATGIYRRPQTAPHDCRVISLQAHETPKRWEALQLSSQLRSSTSALALMHLKKKEFDEHGHRKPDRLLCSATQRGSGPGQLSWPRGLAVNLQGELFVADTHNDRIQIFNSCALQKSSFGRSGDGKGQLSKPTGVAILPAGHVVVMDRGNRRIQIYTSQGRYKTQFSVVGDGYSVCCDKDSNILVATTCKSVEMYTRSGKPVIAFATTQDKPKSAREHNVIYIAAPHERTCVVSEPAERLVKVFSYNGSLLRQFRPLSAVHGLNVLPAGVCSSPEGEGYIICDALNHAINLYSLDGKLKSVLCGPIDECGAVQMAVPTPEGHLAAIEFTANGPHCLKVFRFRRCVCHYTPTGERPGSARKSPALGDPPAPPGAPPPTPGCVRVEDNVVTINGDS